MRRRLRHDFGRLRLMLKPAPALSMFGLMTALAGCSAANATAPKSPAPILSIGIVTPVATLNPVTMGTSEETNFAHFVWAGLIGVDAAGRPFPMLARAVPSYANGLISPHGLAVTFQLRSGLRWSDGKPLTAEDVKFGFELARKSWADVCPATCWAIRGVTVDLPSRVTFRLSQPFGPLLFDLPPVVPRHFIWRGSWSSTRAFLFSPAATWFGTRFPVDGPYRVSASTGSALTLIRNPFWAILSRPAYASVRVSQFVSDSDLLNAVQSGTVDLAQGFDIADIAKGVIDPHHLGSLRLRFFPTGGLEHLEPNLLKGPLHDVRVRQALNLIIDRAALIQASLANCSPRNSAQGGCIPLAAAKRLVAYGPEVSGRFDGQAVPGAWDPIKHRFVTKPQWSDANKLLAEAGWKLQGGLRYKASCRVLARCQLSLHVLVPKTYVDRIAEAQYLQTPWGRRGSTAKHPYLGVRTRLNFTQWSVGNLIAPYKQNGPCAQGHFDLCLFAQLPGYDPQTDFQLEFTSSHIAEKYKGITDLNFPGIDDREIDHIFAVAARTFDLAKRRQLYREWQLRVAKRAYWIPLYQQPLVVLQRKPVSGFQPSSWGAEWNPWDLAPA